MPFTVLYLLAVLLTVAITGFLAGPFWFAGVTLVIGVNTALLVLLALAALMADFLARRRRDSSTPHGRLLAIWAGLGLVLAIPLSLPLQTLLLAPGAGRWEFDLFRVLLEGPWFGWSLLALCSAYIVALAARLFMLRRRSRQHAHAG